ncbi:MAG: hypothetical protein LUE26_07145 [Alistipes sp.]|nr:hypothetical protein [Alistipes sp.]
MKKSGMIALWVLLVLACSDGKDDFGLEATGADLYVSEVAYIGISGSGNYIVSVSDEDVVGAEIINSAILSIRTSHPFVVSLSARSRGTAAVTVTDKASGRTRDIRVVVREAGLVLSMYDIAYTVATPDTGLAREIAGKIEEEVPFPGPHHYVLTSGTGSVMYSVLNNEVTGQRKIHHDTGGNGIYLFIDYGEGGTRRLQLDEGGTGSGVYLDFFGLDSGHAGTRNEITIHFVRFDEELTSRYRGMYPGTEINEVTATYTLLLDYGKVPDDE